MSQFFFINAKIAGGSAYKVIFEVAEEAGISKEREKQVHFTRSVDGRSNRQGLELHTKEKTSHLVLVIDEIDSLVVRSGDDILWNFTRGQPENEG